MLIRGNRGIEAQRYCALTTPSCAGAAGHILYNTRSCSPCRQESPEQKRWMSMRIYSSAVDYSRYVLSQFSRSILVMK